MTRHAAREASLTRLCFTQPSLSRHCREASLTRNFSPPKRVRAHRLCVCARTVCVRVCVCARVYGCGVCLSLNRMLKRVCIFSWFCLSLNRMHLAPAVLNPIPKSRHSRLVLSHIGHTLCVCAILDWSYPNIVPSANPPHSSAPWLYLRRIMPCSPATRCTTPPPERRAHHTAMSHSDVAAVRHSPTRETQRRRLPAATRAASTRAAAATSTSGFQRRRLRSPP